MLSTIHATILHILAWITSVDVSVRRTQFPPDGRIAKQP
jgi:hypothetical protein